MWKGRFICVCVEDGPFIGTDGGIFHDGPDLGAEVVDRLNQGLGVSLCFHEPTVELLLQLINFFVSFAIVTLLEF